MVQYPFDFSAFLIFFPMFRNLIFDWSGTLVDDLGPVIEATNAVLGKYNIAPLDREKFRRLFRLPYREFYSDLLPDVPLEELESSFRPAFDAAVSPVTVLPHAREKLEWCSACGIRSFVLTSMDTTAFERQMDYFGLRHHFEATYSGVSDKRNIIHQLLKNHGLDPDKTAFVGDMTHDVETARHGGISSIAVLTGYNHPEILARARPDITVPDLSSLRILLGNRAHSPYPTATPGLSSSRFLTVSPMDIPDTIEINRLRVHTHIGVPDEERSGAQTLLVTVRLVSNQGFTGLSDDIACTIDYHAVSLAIQKLAASRPRHLIETLALETADMLLGNYPLKRVAIIIEKHILPDAACVAVHLVRER